MELMDISLDKFYKFIYGTLGSSIPEDILGKITVAVSCLFCFQGSRFHSAASSASDRKSRND